MTTHEWVIGIDVGTSGLKALLLNGAGECPGAVTEPYPISTPHPQWSEQHPEDWWNAACTAVRALVREHDVTPSSVRGIGLTGQMHGLVLLDRSHRVLRPAILWNDQRTAAQCDAIESAIGRDRIVSMTGKPVLTGFTAPKILWVREHEPDVFQQAATVLLPKDYVRFRMTGTATMDVADGSGTSLLDLRTRRWSNVVTDALNLDPSLLPRVMESREVAGTLSEVAASQLGLEPGTPIIAGAGDQAAEAIGCGITGPGTVGVAIGTSGVVFAALDQPPTDPSQQLHGYCHAVPDKWHVMGVMLSAGGSLQWFRNQLGRPETDHASSRGVDDYDELLAPCASIAPGSNDLIFLPYLTGERTPHADPRARGAFIGLTTRHTKAHLTRAILEGVSFGLADMLALVRAQGESVDRVRLSGGASRSPLWRQILADVFDAEIATVNVTQGAAFGAAMLALVGIGRFASEADAASSIVRETSVTAPGSDRHAYPECWQRYRDLYPALAPVFHRMEA